MMVQKYAGLSRGDAGCVGASEGAGKEVCLLKGASKDAGIAVLTARAVACCERGESGDCDPTALERVES